MEKFDVFLSHASSDKDVVMATLDQLKRSLPDIKFWVDFEDLNPGDDWTDKIVQAASGASLFLVFGTKAAFESKWVQREIGIGLQKSVLDKIPLVVLNFDPKSLPPDLERYQYIDFTDFDSGIIRLTKFIDDQFRIRKPTRRRTLDTRNLRYRVPGKIYASVSCPDVLAAIPRAELRRRICKKLSRKQVSVLWYDVLENRMDDEVPEQPIANCVMELLLRCDQRERSGMLFEALCSDYPDIASSA